MVRKKIKKIKAKPKAKTKVKPKKKAHKPHTTLGTVEKRMIRDKAKVIEALKDSFGIVTTAIAKVKISNNTFYRWYREDSQFKKDVDEIQDAFDIIVDDKIKAGIIANDGAMVRFYASHRIKKYRPQLGVGLAEDLEPIQLIITTKE